tara:strand:+ start:905 stop:1411 length:507 start_codon:yes stop_codon:yes gene_type:complete
MIEVAITADMLINARDKAAAMGKLYNSITSGAGNIAGFIGEDIAQQVLGGKLDNTYDYDLVLDNGIKIDVKTKQTSVKPLESYECSVANLNIKQACDAYCFVRVKNDFTVGWYLGVYDKLAYLDDAVFMNKGTVDPANGYVVKSDCYNLKISQLKDTYELPKRRTSSN